MSKRYNIRWKQADSEELSKAVKNFNAKISRLEKKNPEIKNALPEKISVKQMKELIDTRQDLKRELNALRRFTQRGSEQLVDVPDNDYNLKMTKWQKQEMTRRIGVINRKRKKRAEEIGDIEATSGSEKLGYTVSQMMESIGMGTVDENSLKPMSVFTPSMTRTWLNKKFRNIMKESQSTYWRRREKIMIENYITAILENYNPKDVRDIIDAIKEMDFKEFYKTFMAEGGTFEIVYPPDQEQYEGYLSKLRSTWLPERK
jgi:hypothetical protein